MDSTALLAAPRKLARRVRLRWRFWVAYGVLAGLVWPSLGPLPWIAEAAAHHHFVAHAIDADDDGAAAPGHHHDDASDIPGSPTHPVDHDCLQCQVLKHLSRCVLLQPGVPDVPLPAGSPVQPSAGSESQYPARIAALPPARAPPLSPQA
jgi:hypothetical protein